MTPEPGYAARRTEPSTPTTPPVNARAAADAGACCALHSTSSAPAISRQQAARASTEMSVLVPDMLFPIKNAPAVAQTQVYRWGGGIKGGDQCDTRNFTAPWRDNYCESRSTTNTTPWCAKTGVHLGQDIRVGTPEGCKAERADQGRGPHPL